MDVRDVGLEVVDDARGDGADRVVPVRLLERARVAEGVVDPDDPQAVALCGANVVFGPARILLAREARGPRRRHARAARVRAPARRSRCRPGRPAGIRGRSPGSLIHQTILDISTVASSPLTADNAPRYWPSGHANASAMARPLATKARGALMPEMNHQRRSDRARQKRQRRNGAQPEQLVQPAMQHVRSSELVARRPIVRMDHFASGT